MNWKPVALFLAILVSIPFVCGHAQEKLILDERFYSNTNAWPEYDNDNNSCRVASGYYESNVKTAEGTWMGAIVLPLDGENDFAIEATMERISGVDNYGYGVTWGIRDVNNFYYFEITGNGYFKYGKCEEAKYTDLIEWTASSAIRTSTGTSTSSNNVSVRKAGSQLTFFINDTQVSQSPFLAFYGSKIGFVVFRQMMNRFTSLRVTQSGPNGSERTVFRDDFTSNANAWDLTDNENHSASITGGKLALEGKLDDKAFFNCIPVTINRQNDYAIETTLSKASGNENTGYGLAWGYADGSNSLMFKISGTGYYQVVRRTNGTDVDLIAWEKTDAVVPSNGTNKLAIRQAKNQLSFYVNDRFMRSIPAEAFPGEQVGFVLDRLIHIDADYLSVKEGGLPTISTSSEQTLLAEEFQNNTNAWDEQSDADLYQHVEGGRYVFEEKRQTGSRLSTIPLTIDESKDYTIESSFSKVSGVDNNGFGIVWGLKDAQNFYRVLITGNGHYVYGKSVDGVYKNPIDWTASDAINEYNAQNKLTVKKSGSSINIFINDKYVNTFPFEPGFGNKVGFVNHYLKRIEIQNFIVKQTVPQTSKLVSSKLDGRVVLQDDFTTNANEWFEADDEMVKLKREYGKYEFEHKRTIGAYLTWMPTSLDANADFTVATTIKKVSGVDNYGYGVIWGVENNKNYYYFLISANGSYLYGKTVNGTNTSLCEWTVSSAIKQYGGPNKLTVKKTADKLGLLINDQLQQTFAFDGSFGNYVGFKIDNNIGIEISDILVTQGSEKTSVVRKQTKKDTTPPVITILEPQASRGMKPTLKEKTILVRGTATDESGVFDVLINDEEARISETGEFEAEVKLRVGENTIVVKASDTKSNIAEERFTIVREAEPLHQATNTEQSADIKSGSYYALLIGVQDYADKTVNSLDHPIPDAQQVMKILTQDYTFDAKNITFLKDPDRKGIIKAFNDLKNRLTDKDNLLVFYAGHGFWDQDLKQGFWLPSDATASDPSDWISNGTIRDFIRGTKAKHTLLITDACFSGGIFKTREAFSKSINASVQKVYEMTSRRAMTSGALKTVPDRSVFVEYLLKRLSENREKYLFAEKLYINMKEAVINNSPNNQTPLYGVIGEAGDEGGDFIFVHR